MRYAAFLILVTLSVVACGGGGSPTVTHAPGASTVAPGQATPDAGQPTTAAQPTPGGAPAPAPGGTSVTVVLTGGPDAGTYTGSGDPGCAFGFMGADTWSANFTVFEGAGLNDLSEAILVYGPSTTESNQEVKASVGIGPLFDPEDFREYEINPDFSDIGGTAAAEIQDGGNTAVIHWTGTTQDGVGIDATVNCPSVAR